MTNLMNTESLKYCVYVALIIVVAYYIYLYFQDSEEFSNNSSVRSDPGGDKKFDQLKLEDKIEYIKSKQNENLSSM